MKINSIYIYTASRAWQNNHSSKRIRIVLGLPYWSRGYIPFCGGDLSSSSSISFGTSHWESICKTIPKCGWMPPETRKLSAPFFLFFLKLCNKIMHFNVQNPRHCQWEERPLWSWIAFYKHFWSQSCGLSNETDLGSAIWTRQGLMMRAFYRDLHCTLLLLLFQRNYLQCKCWDKGHGSEEKRTSAVMQRLTVWSEGKTMRD